VDVVATQIRRKAKTSVRFEEESFEVIPG
jgi:hypothetical protein